MKRKRRITVREHETFQKSLRPRQDTPADDDDLVEMIEHPPAMRPAPSTRRLLAILDELESERGNG